MLHQLSRRTRRRYCGALLHIVLALILFGSLTTQASSQTPPAVSGGVLDLRDWNFATDGTVSLNGEWRFAWRQFVDPVTASRFPGDTLFPVPGIWNEAQLGDTRLDGTGFASYQLQLRLPPDTPSLHLTLPQINMAYELWIDRERVLTVGQIGTSAETEVAKSMPVLLQLPTAEFFTITLLISNHYHMEGGITRPLQVDLSERVVRNDELRLLFSVFTLGALFFLGLHYLIIYTYRHREIEHLLYGLLAWVFLLRLIVTNQLSYVVFDHPHILSTRISYLTMFLAPTLYLKFLHSLFPRDVSRWLANGMLAVGVAGTALAMVTSPMFFTHTRDAFTLVTQFLILYAAFAIALATWRRREDAPIVLVLVLIFGAAAIHDTLIYQRLYESIDIVPFGFLAFMFGHAAILGRRINRALVRETLVHRELEELTASLQRKVEERTSVLAEKVALLQVQERELAIAKTKAETASTAKTRFLYAASHDLRQPVHALNLFVEVLPERIVKGNWELIVDKIKLTLGSLNKLLGDLGEVGRLESGLIVPRKQAFPLQPCFEALTQEFELICSNKGLRLSHVPTSLWCYSDPEMFDRILRNLLSNAIKYTETGRILIGCRRRGAEIRVEVWDTGVGVPAASQQVIFEEFHRLNPEQQRESSVGLGLSIVRQLAALLAHRLELTSTPGSGSCFTLIVAAAAPQSAPPVAEDASAFDPAVIADRLVLCIDDDAAVRASMAELFTAWGARAHCVADLSGAQRVVAGAQADGDGIDLILTDYMLEHGVTGFAVLDALRDQLGGRLPPVIVITADHSAAMLRGAAAQDYPVLSKPMSVAALGSLLRALFGAPRPAGVAL